MNPFDKYINRSTLKTSANDVSLFKDGNENAGIFVKEQFEAELRTAGDKHPSFVGHTKRLIDLMHANRTFSVEPNEGFEHGMKVIWCNFRKIGNYKPILCVPNITGMAELINNYYHGKIAVNVDFDGLAKELTTKSDEV